MRPVWAAKSRPRRPRPEEGDRQRAPREALAYGVWTDSSTTGPVVQYVSKGGCGSFLLVAAGAVGCLTPLPPLQVWRGGDKGAGEESCDASHKRGATPAKAATDALGAVSPGDQNWPLRGVVVGESACGLPDPFVPASNQGGACCRC